MIKPIFEKESTDDIKKQFALLKKALNTSTVPLFFSYIAAFPEYFTYINNQLIANLVHPTFIELRNETLNYVSSLVSTTLSKSNDINIWVNQYKNTPSFYTFQKDLNKIIEVNISLTYIFIALREAVKGWALASKKLPFSAYKSKEDIHAESPPEQAFLYDDIAQEIAISFSSSQLQSTTSSIVTTAKGLEKQLLPEYLDLCKYQFSQELKQSYFWTMRLGFEQLFLLNLQRLPEFIFSPINIVYRLTDKYINFNDLLYLLSEHFPTYAMHRMIYSAYLLQ